jgi:hypothetical protein
MNTTNIFVELVVIGFHTLVWMGLIILTFVGYENLNVEKLFTIHWANLSPSSTGLWLVSPQPSSAHF